MMKLGGLALVAAAAACAPITPAAVYRTPVQLTIPSSKSPHDFAMCAANELPDGGTPLSEGNHYWLNRTFGSAVIERWDFLPTPTGSIAERRSGQLAAGGGTSHVRGCA